MNMIDFDKLRKIRDEIEKSGKLNCVSFAHLKNLTIYSVNGIKNYGIKKKGIPFDLIEKILENNPIFIYDNNAFTLFRCHTTDSDDGLETFYQKIKKTGEKTKKFANILDYRIPYRDIPCQHFHKRLYTCAEKKLFSRARDVRVLYVTKRPCNFCLPLINVAYFCEDDKIYRIEKFNTMIAEEFRYKMEEIF